MAGPGNIFLILKLLPLAFLSRVGNKLQRLIRRVIYLASVTSGLRQIAYDRLPTTDCLRAAAIGQAHLSGG